MAFADDETPMDEHQEFQKKATIMQDVAQLRDQLFDEGQTKVVKAIGLTLVGMYFVYRFLMKR